MHNLSTSHPNYSRTCILVPTSRTPVLLQRWWERCMHVESDPSKLWCLLLFTNVTVNEAVSVSHKRLRHWGTGPFFPQNGLQSCWWCAYTSAMEDTSMNRRKVQQWLPGLCMKFFWHWRWHQPDPGYGRSMLTTLFAYSGRALLKSFFVISMVSGQPSSSL